MLKPPELHPFCNAKISDHSALAHPVLILMIALCCLWLSACTPPDPTVYTIVSPASGDYTEAPAEFRVSYNQAPGNPVFTLNGTEVQQYFSFNDSEASADGTPLKDFLLQGDNRFAVAPPSGPARQFFFDNAGPRVVIVSVDSNEPRKVRGMLDDPSGAVTLSVNGSSIAVNAAGEFSLAVDRADTYLFVAVDTLGHVSETVFVDEDFLLNPALQARVSEEAIQVVAPIAAEQMAGADLRAAMQELNPVYEQTWQGALGETYGMTVNVEDAQFGEVIIHRINIEDSDDGSLSFDVDIYDLVVDLDIIAHNGVAPDSHHRGTVYADFANAAGRVIVTALDGQMNFEIPELLIEMDGLRTDFEELPDAVEHLAAPALEVVVDVLKQQVSDIVAHQMEEVLQRELSEIVVQTQINIDGMQFGLDTGVQHLATQSRNLVVTLDAQLHADTPHLAVPKALGSVFTESAMPDAAFNGDHVTAVVSANLLNQAMLVAHQVGMTHFTLVANRLYLGASPDDSVGTSRIRVTQSSPAQFSMFGEQITGVLLAMDNMNIIFEQKQGDVWQSPLEISMSLMLRLAIDVSTDNKVQVELLSLPKLRIEAIENRTGLPVDEATVQNLIDSVIPMLEPVINKSLLSVEIPAIAGLQILPRSIESVGEGYEHLSFSCDLQAAP